MIDDNTIFEKAIDTLHETMDKAVSKVEEMKNNNEIEFWKQRAYEYCELNLKLLNKLSSGQQVSSMKLTQDGLVFEFDKKKSQSEATSSDHIANISKKVDPIDRQAAIDAARDWYEGLICGSFNGLEKRLRALPSIQPERKNDIIQKFHDYQIEWLKSHYDLTLESQLEEAIIRFLHDTANMYMLDTGRATDETD